MVFGLFYFVYYGLSPFFSPLPIIYYILLFECQSLKNKLVRQSSLSLISSLPLVHFFQNKKKRILSDEDLLPCLQT